MIRGTYKKLRPEPPPRCPRCGWSLTFFPLHKKWFGCCWNPECEEEDVTPERAIA